MTRPQRDDYTRWFNEKPITNLEEALHLLNHEGTSDERHHLRQHEEVWEIVAPWYTHGDSGGDRSGQDYYQIDNALAERLASGILMVPLRVNYMGGFYLDHDRLVASAAARSHLHLFESEMRTRALGLLVPGTHTDLTGEPRSAGWGREHRLHGRMYFDFAAPNDAHCRIYPETGELIFPYTN